MARKHNTKHNRGVSHYPERLKKRGVSSASVAMPFFYIDEKTGNMYQRRTPKVAG